MLASAGPAAPADTTDAAKSWYHQQPQAKANFEPGFGDNTYGRREMLASVGPAAPADTTDAAKAWYYQQPQAMANFEPGFRQHLLPPQDAQRLRLICVGSRKAARKHPRPLRDAAAVGCNSRARLR